MRSDEWDIKEKKIDEQSNIVKKFISDKEFRNKFRECMDIYDSHRKANCKHVHLLIRQNRITGILSIEILECRDCGWNYNKKWWKFW
ncbi:MAG: hypothetical protein O6761_07865 [Thaumarchaeota archaeon]|nr:hypothetical protein [Nitrososphaerota archaeon]